MRFVVICTDKAGHIETRKSNREAHLAYIRDTGLVEQAGPFVNDAGEMCGSLIILNAPDLAAARHWADNDPYAMAGLFANVRIEAWNRVIGPKD